MSKIQQQQQSQPQQHQLINTSPTKTNGLNLKHWSQKKHESVLSSDLIEKTNFIDALNGGSDNGQFIFINKNFNIEQLQFNSGKFISNEIVLEIQNYKISGYTLYDVQLLLKQILKTYATITFVTVKSNTLPIDLRTYLDERFQKGSIDYDLQQTIRENVYMRTVPCTTRAARPGEVNGQDYIFLTNGDFLELEKNGDLLEYGVYNGHYYGTPKPPKEPQLLEQQQQQHLEKQYQSNNNNNNNNKAQQKQQKKLKKSGISPAHVQTNGINNNISSTNGYNNNNRFNNSNSNNNNSPVQQQQPSQIQPLSSSSLSMLQMIPFGWQKVEDAEYGTFYIDHINKQTTYENPLLQQKLQQQQQTQLNNNNNTTSISSLKTFKPSNMGKFDTIDTFDKLNLLDQQPQHQHQHQHQNNLFKQKNIFFTRNPNELKGEFLKTTLLKTHQGFGFTIIGANETSEDFLQIKHVVPNGAADLDNILKQGDVLVYVNNECVLGYTHQDVVEMFQSIPIGDYVELTVCRGYPLSIDLNDPTIEIKSLPAINKENFDNNNHINLNGIDQNDYASPTYQTTLDNSTNEIISNNHNNNNNENIINNIDDDYIDIYVSIVKGPMGFGFTIADDAANGQQKVKQILDRERCVDLLEGDVLCEINGKKLGNMTHMQIVEILKECSKGKETYMKLKRLKINHLINHKSSTIKLNDLMERGAPNNTDVKPKQVIINNNQNNQNTGISNINGNQFNFTERRSKTPSNLFSSNQNTETNVTLPLRSKTPTTDRYAAMPPIPHQQQQQQQQQPKSLSSSSTTALNQNDNYYYLNQAQQSNGGNNNNNNNNINSIKSQLPQSKSATAISAITTTPITPPGTGASNSNNIIFNPQDLYSTVNKQAILNNNNNNSRVIPIENNNINSNFQLKENHIFNNNEDNNNNNAFPLNINNRNINSGLRSKTPGPELFRDRTNITNMSANNIHFKSSQQQQQMNQYQNEIKYDQISSPTKYNTLSNQIQQRSKTPTADMYYSTNQRNDYNFDTIYQPFIPRKQPQQQSQQSQQQQQLYNNNNNIQNDIYGSNIEYKYIDIIVELHRQESGFGFRIVGGDEEGSQVAVGYIVPNGAADLDSRLKPNDEIIMIDNENVVGASHKRVVKLMTIAGLNRKVKLWVKRKVPISIGENLYPYTITLFRNGNEGFGFVIISTLNRSGPSIGEQQLGNSLNPCSWIGKIVENSPAERCGRLKVGDRILAVNNIDITQMNHVDIVKLIKESGNSITLTIGAPKDDPFILPNDNSPNFTNLPSNYDLAPVPPSRNDSKGIIKPTTPTPMATLTSSKSRIIPNNIINQSTQNIPIQQQQQQQQQSQMFISPASSQQPNLNKSINQGEYHLIELRKQSNTGFGFSIRGGKEFNIPIFVLKLADNGPASLDGRLRVGDQILEINGFDAYNMTHNEAIERIKSGGNIVSLLVRRTGLPPPSITDIIAATNNPNIPTTTNGSVNNISPTIYNQNTTNTIRPTSASIINQQQNNNTVFPYHQSDSTLLRPKSPYINPELAYLQQQQQQQIFIQQQHQQNFQQQQQQQRTSHSLSALTTNRNY